MCGDAYDPAELADAGRAGAASLGCGNPLAVAELVAGETVLDLGSGAGLDVLLSARRVGPEGFAYGLDMTDEMLDLARAHAAEAGATNVEFLRGHIEAIPLPDASVDVVISNCVINLSADKPAVFAEIARVLRPGGRVGVSDLVADDQADAATVAEAAARSGPSPGFCAGAPTAASWRRPGSPRSPSRPPTRSPPVSSPPSSRRRAPETARCTLHGWRDRRRLVARRESAAQSAGRIE